MKHLSATVVGLGNGDYVACLLEWIEVNADQSELLEQSDF
jgi:hypothetical protein